MLSSVDAGKVSGEMTEEDSNSHDMQTGLKTEAPEAKLPEPIEFRLHMEQMKSSLQQEFPQLGFRVRKFLATWPPLQFKKYYSERFNL